MATTDIDRINRQLEGIEEDLEAVKKLLKAGGLSEAMQIALRKNIDSYIIKEADLRAQKRELEGSAPSGNPINLSQSLHKVCECVVVVSFLVSFVAPPLPP